MHMPATHVPQVAHPCSRPLAGAIPFPFVMEEYSANENCLTWFCSKGDRGKVSWILPTLILCICLFPAAISCTMLYNVLNFPAGVVPVTTVTEADEEELRHYQGLYGDPWDKKLKEVRLDWWWKLEMEMSIFGTFENSDFWLQRSMTLFDIMIKMWHLKLKIVLDQILLNQWMKVMRILLNAIAGHLFILNAPACLHFSGDKGCWQACC